MSWICSTCGQDHDDLPLSFAAEYPDNLTHVPMSEREQRCLIGSDQCVIDEKEFYLRGCLEIPLVHSGEVFLWGLWASVFPEDFAEIADCWEEVGRENRHGPFKGRLANNLREYPQGTADLKLRIEIRPVGERPLFFIEEPDHELAIAQNRGMTIEEAQLFAEKLLHAVTTQS